MRAEGADALAAAVALLTSARGELLLCSLLVLLLGLVILRQQRRLKETTRALSDLDKQLVNALHRITRLEDCQMQGGQPLRPEVSLPREDLKSRLQAPVSTGEPPNRYRHVAALSQQGMNAEQISDVLHISVAEATQLMSLCRLARLADND
ncbi:MAG: hypothetical protein JXR59_02060 [Desulfuromonadaceae bacterium]|nr:hypothetical protein [Desulfuromonadaceae bacterium]